MKKRADITHVLRDKWIADWELQNERSPHYVSFIKTQDIKSLGSKSRTPDFAEAGQDRDLLSTNERHYFYRLRFSGKFVWIKEQFPLLPVNRTVAIAKQLGVKHPTYPYSSNVEVVMTSDFYCRTILGEEVVYSIKDAASDDKLTPKQQKNVDNKLKIECAYWESKGVKWRLIKSYTLKSVFTQNLEQLFPAYELKPLLSVYRERWIQCFARSINQDLDQPLRVAIEAISKTLSISYFDSVHILHHCLWHKKVIADLQKLLRFECLMSEFNFRVNQDV